jgi:hypothetical protein
LLQAPIAVTKATRVLFRVTHAHSDPHLIAAVYGAPDCATPK